MIRNRISETIQYWKDDAHIHEPIMYDINWETREIIIYTTRPGWLIGVGGERINRYEEKMKEVFPLFKRFLFKEIQEWVY